MKKNDIFVRAVKTFVQAFVPVLISAFAVAERIELSELRAVFASALISAAAAGLSAAWNAAASAIERKEESGSKSG